MIRSITANDLETVFGIMKSNMQPYFEARGEVWNEDSIRRSFMPMNNAAVEVSGKIRAFTFYEFMPDSIHIHTLQVAPDRQHRTLGGTLFRWYLALAKERQFSRLSCCVYEANPALALYVRLGFEEVGRDDDIVRLSLSTDTTHYGYH